VSIELDNLMEKAEREFGRMEDRHEAEVNVLTEQIAQLNQAMGLLSTLHPKLGIDIKNPMAMAEQIYAHIMDYYYERNG